MTTDPLKIILLVWVCGMLSYLIVMKSGTGAGQVNLDTISGALMAIFATKMVDWVIQRSKAATGKVKHKRKKKKN